MAKPHETNGSKLPPAAVLRLPPSAPQMALTTLLRRGRTTATSSQGQTALQDIAGSLLDDIGHLEDSTLYDDPLLALFAGPAASHLR